jgi:DNA-directed RNA polymerase II subunit RPB1
MTIHELFESLFERQLNLAHDTSGQYAKKHLKEDDNVQQMVVAGSKGSFINILQMSVCVGQQSVEGCHIPFGSVIVCGLISQRMTPAQSCAVLSRTCIFAG